jgi:transposase-like protein
MPVLSHVHHLFNAEQYHASIHTLRWKDRPLPCPRCQRDYIGRWGTYQYRPGCKRYWCHGCKRTFNDLTATLLHQSQRSLYELCPSTTVLRAIIQVDDQGGNVGSIGKLKAFATDPSTG